MSAAEHFTVITALTVTGCCRAVMLTASGPNLSCDTVAGPEEEFELQARAGTQ